MTVAGPRRISTGFLPAVALGSIAHTRATVTGGVRPAQSAAAAEQDFRSLGIRQTPPSPASSPSSLRIGPMMYRCG